MPEVVVELVRPEGPELRAEPAVPEREPPLHPGEERGAEPVRPGDRRGGDDRGSGWFVAGRVHWTHASWWSDSTMTETGPRTWLPRLVARRPNRSRRSLPGSSVDARSRSRRSARATGEGGRRPQRRRGSPPSIGRRPPPRTGSRARRTAGSRSARPRTGRRRGGGAPGGRQGARRRARRSTRRRPRGRGGRACTPR